VSSPQRSVGPAWRPQQETAFLSDVIDGLVRFPKSLPCKYFYDAAGSALFETICALPEYYLTRTELEIMNRHAEEMAETLGPGVLLVEPGSGASLKTRLLLKHLPEPAAYVPVDISPSALVNAARELLGTFTRLEVVPVCADFSEPFELPLPRRRPERTVVYFPGSTVGNFDPPRAVALLRRLGGVCGPGGAVLVGVDLDKPTPVLEAAYNDSQGVTAEFNKNLLRRINAELGADFDLDRFEHVALFNEGHRRIEMHLESNAVQTVGVAGRAFQFRRGERIHTESSYKYSLAGFQDLAKRAGFSVGRVWTDPAGLFSVQYLAPDAWARRTFQRRRRAR
jgi:L-histidine N-alpha-methyltransferase